MPDEKRIMTGDALTADEVALVAKHDANGEEARRIYCGDGCGTVMGTLAFPKGTDERKWETAGQGYYVPEHAPVPVAVPTIEEMMVTITDLVAANVLLAAKVEALEKK